MKQSIYEGVITVLKAIGKKQIAEANRYKRYLQQKDYEKRQEFLKQIHNDLENKEEWPQSEIEQELDAMASIYNDKQGDTPEERLANIKQGEKADEWNRMSKQELDYYKERDRRKRALIATGKLDSNDTEYWTEEDWDEYFKKYGENPTKSKVKPLTPTPDKTMPYSLGKTAQGTVNRYYSSKGSRQWAPDGIVLNDMPSKITRRRKHQ
jgi:hypothetical protein